MAPDDMGSQLGEVTLLVNAAHPVPPSWVPEGLVDLWTLQPRHFVLKPRAMLMDLRAARAANELFAAAEADGLPDFMIVSAYRDAASQAALLARSPEGYAALPGASEHQTGLCMDVGRFARGFSLDARRAEWLAENCWDAGFVVRYPEGAESITGVMHEPWHLRYVGREVALQMRERGWTLEEWHAYRAGAPCPSKRPPQLQGKRQT